MLLKNINQDNVNDIARIHLISFSGFFLSSLGLNFLKIYYSSCLKNKNTIAIGLFDECGNLQGFAIGTSNASGFQKEILINNFYKFFISLIRMIILRPSILIRLVFNLNKSPQKRDLKDYAELLSIAVLPNLKGYGYGKMLLDEFEFNAKKMGVNKVALTTDFYDNDTVINFYTTNNYRIYYDFMTYPNRKMYKMIKNLTTHIKS
jgi:ribosomal protein S18 acetylase RimI-like enzyme